MKKVIKYTVLFVFFSGCFFNANYSATIDGVWIPEKIVWDSPEIEELEDTKYAGIIIMHFLNDGTFKMYKCLVYYVGNGLLNISVPEDFAIYKGKWKKENDKEIVITYKEIFRTIEVVRMDGKKTSSENITELFFLERHNDIVKLSNDKIVFIRSNQFTEKSKTFMSRW